MTKFSHALIAAAALAFGGAASAANLVTNGDFETGNFDGWTVSGDTSYTGVGYGSVFGTNSYFGSFGAVYSDTYLSQDLAVSSTATYTVSFDLYNADAGGSGEDFTLSFGGTTLLTADTSVSGVTHYSFEVTGGNGVLSIATMNQPSYWYLDNVSVTATAVPEAGSSAMLLAGLGLMGAVARRRRAAR